MGISLKEFQAWLNTHGAKSIHHDGPIAVDGKRGAETRAAIFQVFTDLKAKAITETQRNTFALRLGGTLKQLKAVSIVESGKSGWNEQGQPAALYERHYAWKRLRIIISMLSDPKPGGYTIDADKDGLNDSWEKIADMAMRDPEAAFESASFGKFQIMGAWAKKLGYANAIEMAYSLVSSEAAHYEVMVRYVDVLGGRKHFQALSSDWRTCTPFAKFFNGPKQVGYDRRLAKAMT